MNQYSFSDEIKKEEEGDLLDKLKKVDKDYSIQSNKDVSQNDLSLNLEKMTFFPLSDDEISKKAEDSLSDYKNSSLSSIQDNYEKNIAEITKNTKKAQENTQNELNSLETAVEFGKEKSQTDAIKKGLTRSSIFDNSLQAYDDLHAEKTTELTNKLNANIEKLIGEKSLLETQKESAINSFNIAYAVKLNEKIDSINAELLKQEQVVLKYNNSVEEIEKDFLLEGQKLNLSEQESVRKSNEFLANYIAKNGSVGLNRLKGEAKLSLAKDYYSNMSTGDALAHLSLNPEIRTSLGSYYSKLLDYLSSRNG